jgi:putative membrane protein
MRFKQIVVAMLFFWATPAIAQFGNPAFMAPGSADTPAEAPLLVNTTDRIFARLMNAGGNGEIELARLAQQRAQDQRVRAFASQMVADHGPANGRLAMLANQVNIKLPSGIDPDQAKIRTILEAAQPILFDTIYMDAQVIDHVKTAQLLTWIIGSGQNAGLQKFAIELLPTVLHHLEMARDLSIELRSRTPSRAAFVP